METDTAAEFGWDEPVADYEDVVMASHRSNPMPPAVALLVSVLLLAILSLVLPLSLVVLEALLRVVTVPVLVFAYRRLESRSGAHAKLSG